VFLILRDEKYRRVLNGERKEKIKYVKEKDGSKDERERERGRMPEKVSGCLDVGLNYHKKVSGHLG
jgi:hypothetical protein